METKYSKFIRIGFLGGLLLVLFGYYYTTIQIIESKEELKEIEKSKEKARQEMLLYQSKTKSLTNVIQQTGDTVAIKKAVAIVTDTKPVTKSDNFEINPVKNKSNYNTALTLEEQAYQALLSKDVEQSISAFKQSENTYNGFKMSYEITRYLDKNKETLKDPNSAAWKTTYAKIATDYSWKMPTAVKSKLISESKGTSVE